MENLTIVSSCCGYGRYLSEWAESIVRLNRKPAAVCLFTHGNEHDRLLGQGAIRILNDAGIPWRFDHSDDRLDFGTARNRAVAMAETEWVMHLDADDMVMPHCLDDVASIAPGADVVGLGYERSGDLASGPSNRTRVYSDGDGLKILDHAAPCSGVSPFRRSFWERSPYRTDMKGAWDTALWIGFARLGARFRATKRPGFWYRQHADSVFNKRRTTFDWTHAHTVSKLRSLRRDDNGVAIIVPLDARLAPDRVVAWRRVRDHYADNFPQWPIVEGVDNSTTWRKGTAIANALSLTRAATIIIADADCIVDPAAIAESVARVASGRSPWSVPHARVLRLNVAATAAFLGGKTEVDERRDLARPAYQGFAGGGILVVDRVGYEATGGIPQAFRGWGGEDQALAVILDTCLGPHHRGDADLIHLWHEPQLSKRMGGGGNQFRFQALAAAARGGPDALLAAIRSLPGDKPWKRQPDVAPPLSRKDRQNFLLRRQRRSGG